MRDDWLEITSRLAVGAIPEIDVEALSGSGSRGARLADDGAGAASVPVPPTGRIWALADPSAARFGVRVRNAPADVRPFAARLVAAALERNAYPVILSHVHRSGFEHLGFRVERIHAGSDHEAQTQEAELVALWGLAIVVDLDDVEAFS